MSFDFFRTYQLGMYGSTVPQGLEWVPYGSCKLSDGAAQKRARHCFTDDRRFESLWTHDVARRRATETLVACTVPDFSMAATSDPLYSVMQLTRMHLVGCELQRLGEINGCRVVPVLAWPAPVMELLDFATAFITPGATCAVRAHGGFVTPAFLSALDYCRERIRWDRLLWVGPLPEDQTTLSEIEVIQNGRGATQTQ